MHKSWFRKAGSRVFESQGCQNLSDVSPPTLGCRRAPSHEQLEGRQLLGKQSWGHGYNAIPVDCKPSRLCIEVCRYLFIIPNEMHQSLRTEPNLGSPTEKNRLRFQPNFRAKFRGYKRGYSVNKRAYSLLVKLEPKYAPTCVLCLQALPTGVRSVAARPSERLEVLSIVRNLDDRAVIDARVGPLALRTGIDFIHQDGIDDKEVLLLVVSNLTGASIIQTRVVLHSELREGNSPGLCPP
jgi:hypothetical protein